MLKQKKWLLFVIIAIAVVLAGVFSIFIIQGNKDVEHDFNLDDIAAMNIGAEMPKIIYGDNEKLIMNGTFGIVYFDMQSQYVYNRIHVDDIVALDVQWADVSVSKNGKNIYVTDLYSPNGNIYKYNQKKNSFHKISEIEEELFVLKETSLDTDSRYSSYIILDEYLLGSQALEIGDQLYYLRANNDWSMQSLQLVRVNKTTGEEVVVNIF